MKRFGMLLLALVLVACSSPSTAPSDPASSPTPEPMPKYFVAVSPLLKASPTDTTIEASFTEDVSNQGGKPSLITYKVVQDGKELPYKSEYYGREKSLLLKPEQEGFVFTPGIPVTVTILDYTWTFQVE